MPMQVGTLMVSIRAQDFASRTLRRVSSEFAGMSRAQMMAAKKADVAWQRQRALNQVMKAQTDMKPLRLIARRNDLLGRQADLTKRLASEQAKLSQLYRQQPRVAGRLAAFTPQQARLMQTARKNIGGLQKDLSRAEHQLGRLSTAFNTMGGSILRASQSTYQFGKQWRAASGRLAEAERNLSIADQRMLQFQRTAAMMPVQKLHDAGHALSGIGRTMQLFGAIGTLAMGLSANAFADFNSQVTLAATQTRKAGQSFVSTAANADKLTKVIMGMMQEFPASSEEMATAAYNIFSSMDVSFGGGIKLLREFNKVAVAGGVDLETATKGSILVLENFDTQLRNTGKVTQTTHDLLNRMFAIVRYGNMNFAQFAQMLNQVVPAAKGAQQSFDDVAGAMAFLTRHMGPQFAAVGIARLLDVFTSPDFIKGMSKAGLAIETASGKMLPFPKIIEQIMRLKPTRLNDLIRTITAFGRGKGIGREFTSQARRALKPLIANNQEYVRVQNETISNNDEFRNSFMAMQNTLGVRWKVFLNQLKVLVLYVGQKAIPVFLQIGDVIGKWIKKWQSLSDATRGSIVKWVTLISVGSLVGGVILAIVGSLASLVAAMITIGPKISGFMTRFTKLATTLRGIAGLTAIVVSIELIKKGGGWALFGGILGGAGIGALLRGGRGTILGATIAIGVELIMKGNSWQSKIGQILLGAATGFAAGGPGGAAFGAATALIFIKLAEMNPKKKLSSMQQAYQNYLDRPENHFRWFWEADPKSFDKFKADVKKFKIPKIGEDVADRRIKPFEDPKRPRSLRQQIADAKTFTEILAAVNSQTQATTDSMEKLAAQIHLAFSQGNVADAAKMLNDFTSKKLKGVTAQNVLGLVSSAVAAGDLRTATDYLNQWADKVKQGREDMKKYREDMKQYAKDVADATKQAMTDTISNFRELYKTLLEENQTAMGDLFQGPFLTSETFDLAKEWGINPRARDLIKDMNMQSNVFVKRNKQLASLAKKGIPRGLIEEIRKMSPDIANPLLAAMMKAKPGEVQGIIRAYKRRQALIQKQTRMDFRSEIAQFKKAGIKMGEALAGGFQDAIQAKNIDAWVKRNFSTAISNAVNQIIKDFKAGKPPPTMPAGVGTPTGTNRTGRGGRGSRIIGGPATGRTAPGNRSIVALHRQAAGALFNQEGPQFYGAAFSHNIPFAKPGPYFTRLGKKQEIAFRKWVKRWQVAFDPNAIISDYDMRGYFRATKGAPHRPGTHFTDRFKTPYDTSFSAESKFASKNNPFKWKGNKLIDTRSGQVVFDENARKVVHGGRGKAVSNVDDHSKHQTNNFHFHGPLGPGTSQDFVKKAAFKARNAVKRMQ